jgi:histidinol-phosphate/aromatic aminotransferase/cobyric acid decarboxylase-like protein
LRRRDRYVVDLNELQEQTRKEYDLIVLVNPNNPTGQHIPRAALAKVLRDVPAHTRVWVDEAYIDYVGPGESLEAFASRSENVIVCKSMSKVYALSGMRVAYLCAAMHQLSDLVAITPPWAVGLPAQVAAVRALQDEFYYRDRYQRTHSLRVELIEGLQRIGIREIVPGAANFVMFHLDPEHPTAAAVVSESKKRGVFFRDVSSMGSALGPRALRIAVKNKETNTLIVETLEKVLSRSWEQTL